EAVLARFAEHLFDHVQIMRVAVPPRTDLNRYFEVMNNRGEQLEKHEVLKARMLSALHAGLPAEEWPRGATPCTGCGKPWRTWSGMCRPGFPWRNATACSESTTGASSCLKTRRP